MTTGSSGIRPLSGALVSVSAGPPASTTTIAFQYNPATLTRSFQPQISGGEQGDRSQVVRYQGAPVQTIQVEIEIDGMDGLEQGDQTTQQYGIAPQLAALELLVYPSLDALKTLESDTSSGVLEVAPLAAPRLLFVWGPQRALPVRIDSLSISEEIFDQQLNPLRASINLGLRVLTYSDLSSDLPDYQQFKAYQSMLQTLAGKISSKPDLGYSPAIK